MWLPKQIINDVKDDARVFYVDWTTCRYWNESRVKGEPLIFSGWYWSKGTQEGGPFKSQSACYRDAWFRAVTHRAPPTVGDRNTREQDERRQKAKRKQQRAEVSTRW